ncbi:hypothetical protein LY76DRAFT_588195 [Colletotrichum caudatum]|nr:hypothetical protein LY76DRAFT_588195 [Colletotrichum caudatum]
MSPVLLAFDEPGSCLHGGGALTIEATRPPPVIPRLYPISVPGVRRATLPDPPLPQK